MFRKREFGPERKTGPEEEKSVSVEEEKVSFGDLIQDAKNIHEEIEERREKKRQEEELKRFGEQKKQKDEEKYEEAELLNRSYDMGRIYYYHLKPGYNEVAAVAARRKREIAPGKFTFVDFGEDVKDKKFSTASGSKHQIKQEMFKEDRPLPGDFIESVKEHTDWTKRETERNNISSESMKGKLKASLENLKMLLEGYSSEAFYDNDLRYAVKGWIALDKIEDPQITKKIKGKIDEWRSSGDYPLDLEIVTSDLLKYQKEKKAGKEEE